MTTLPEEWTDDEQQEYSNEPERDAYGFTVVPVRVMHDENERLAPSFCAMMTWPVPQTGVQQALLVVPRNDKRYKAKFVLNFPGAGTFYMNTKPDPLNNPTPQGFTYTVTAAGNYNLPDYDTMQPIYVIATIANVTISIMDETFGQVASP